MKKNYMSPRIATAALQAGPLLTTASTEGITFGGTDNGTHEASSRGGDFWDNEEE